MGALVGPKPLPAAGWCAGPTTSRRWRRRIQRLNGTVMTVYLWHFAPVLVIAAALYPEVREFANTEGSVWSLDRRVRRIGWPTSGQHHGYWLRSAAGSVCLFSVPGGDAGDLGRPV